jgi:hypothetical protein
MRIEPLSLILRFYGSLILAGSKMLLLLLLLVTSAAVASGVEVIDYLGRDVEDVYSGSTILRGKGNQMEKNTCLAVH